MSNNTEHTLHDLFVDDLLIGAVQVIGEQVITDDGESIEAEYHLRLIDNVEGVTNEDIRTALKTFFRKSCSCEHDCCAHWFGGMVGDVQYYDGLYHARAEYHMNV